MGTVAAWLACLELSMSFRELVACTALVALLGALFIRRVMGGKASHSPLGEVRPLGGLCTLSFLYAVSLATLAKAALCNGPDKE